MVYKTIIVEDENLSMQRLKTLLKKYDNIEVIETVDNGPDAVDVINRMKPDLLFLDIQIPGFDSFEVLNRIDNYPFIIFTTAYDEYALKAFETSSIDYILKPVEEDRLEKAINKLQKMTGTESDQSVYENLEKFLSSYNKKKLNRITVKVGDEILFINTEDIIFFKSENKYTALNTFDSDFLINESMNFLEENLPDNFKRVHRSYIINVDHLDKLKKWFGYKYKAIMKDKDKSAIPISKDFKISTIA